MAILGAIIALFIGIFIFISNGSDDKFNSTNTQPTSHIKGEGRVGVTLTEYGDYQCNVCLAYEPILQQVIDKYQNDIRFQFRNLPLAIHQNAFAAARAAEAAALQNKFWEMHDQLYDPEDWTAWTNSINPTELFNQYAAELGLNIEQFKADFASRRMNDAIRADIAAFNKTGQSMATPSFFINGQYIPLGNLTNANGAPTLERFSIVIDAEISKQQP